MSSAVLVIPSPLSSKDTAPRCGAIAPAAHPLNDAPAFRGVIFAHERRSLRSLVLSVRGPSRTTGTKKGCQFAYAGCLQSPTCPAARSLPLWASVCGQHGRSPSRSGNPRRQPRARRCTRRRRSTGSTPGASHMPEPKLWSRSPVPSRFALEVRMPRMSAGAPASRRAPERTLCRPRRADMSELAVRAPRGC